MKWEYKTIKLAANIWGTPYTFPVLPWRPPRME